MRITKSVRIGAVLTSALLAGLVLFPAATCNAASGVKINKDNFPDANFREAVKNYDLNNNGTLSDSEISNVMYLYIDSRGISNLKGIEKFKNLQSLSCTGNNLTSIDLSSNTKLTYVNCQNNKLTSIKGLDKLKDLQTLYISSNQFASVSGLSSLKNLRTLVASNNNIKTIDLTSNTALSSVELSNNKLTSVKGFEKLTNLTYLYINNNQLTSLDVSKMSSLYYLICNQNKLTTLKLPSSGSSLRYLYCQENSLKTLDVSDTYYLSLLRCSDNPLTKLTLANPVLTSLYCSHTNITSLDVSGSPALQTLSCSGNKIKTLDVSGNRLLSTLSVNGNGMTELKLGKADNLQILVCDNNKLKTLDCSTMSKLMLLTCHDNELTSLDLRNTPEIAVICAQNNKFDYAHINVISGKTSSIYANVPDNIIETVKESVEEAAPAVSPLELVKNIQEGTSSGGSVGGSDIKSVVFKSSNAASLNTVQASGSGLHYLEIKGKAAGAATVKCSVNGQETKYKVHVLYADVTDPSDYWFEPTRELTEAGIVKGYKNQTEFRPANKCTRAQMITFLYRLQGEPKTKSGKCEFKDIKSTDYFYKPVIWAVEQGITTVPSDKKFNPQTVCTRAMTVTFVWRMAGKPEPKSTSNPFPDVKKTDYFYKATIWASEMKILAGFPDGTFKPQGECLRRQMVTFLYKYDKFVNK